MARELERLTGVMAAAGALRVIVYGSFARKQVGPESDLDLIVVVPDDGLGFVARLGRLYGLTQPSLPCDILAYTQAELDALAPASDLVGTALREGRTVYARSAPPGV